LPVSMTRPKHGGFRDGSENPIPAPALLRRGACAAAIGGERPRR
jgi:hypothetical protein